MIRSNAPLFECLQPTCMAARSAAAARAQHSRSGAACTVPPSVVRCRRALIADRKSKVKEGQIGIVRADKLQITAADDSPEKLAANLHVIMQAIPDIVVAGISTVRRAVIQSSQKKDKSGGELPAPAPLCAPLASAAQQLPASFLIHVASVLCLLDTTVVWPLLFMSPLHASCIQWLPHSCGT